MKRAAVLIVAWILCFSFAHAEDVFSLSVHQQEEKGFSMQVMSVQSGSAPRIYIYHTHTYEAYSMEDGNRYQETETWRTADDDYNMIRVGTELAAWLENAGFQVYHDKTEYEPPRLSSAYSRSLEGLEKTQNDPWDLYIDLHRDSYSQGNGPNTVDLSGTEAARLLILVGKGTGQTAEEETPDWKNNEKIGRVLTEHLNSQAAELCRGVSLKSGRYNQHAVPNCLLIEVGNNRNTLTQALNSMRPLALAICAYFDGRD